MVMVMKITKRSIFKQNITTDIQYNHLPLYGKVLSRIEVIPVPILTENQLEHEELAKSTTYTRDTYAGVKFRTRWRQSPLCFDRFV